MKLSTTFFSYLTSAAHGKHESAHLHAGWHTSFFLEKYRLCMPHNKHKLRRSTNEKLVILNRIVRLIVNECCIFTKSTMLNEHEFNPITRMHSLNIKSRSETISKANCEENNFLNSPCLIHAKVGLLEIFAGFLLRMR